MERRPDVAAYIWPSYTGDELRTRMFWPKGYGEWETVQDAVPRFPGHNWPRKPVWGYVNEADPFVMEMEINAAVRYGVNVFIYDWYWYDHRPFLPHCLENGFLKAENRSLMKFYVMWANHDVNYLWDRRISAQHLPVNIWEGKVDRKDFEIIGRYYIDTYFHLPEYYLIDNKPVLSIYEMGNLIKGLGGVEETADALNWLNEQAIRDGFAGIHYQQIIRPHDEETVARLPLSSVADYNLLRRGKDYEECCRYMQESWEKNETLYNVPYFPHVSIGWDNTPRYYNATADIVTGSNPAKFEDMLRRARDYALRTGAPLLTINSWNEWTEGEYLQPDDLNGYAYLEAVRSVFGSWRKEN